MEELINQLFLEWLNGNKSLVKMRLRSEGCDEDQITTITQAFDTKHEQLVRKARRDQYLAYWGITLGCFLIAGLCFLLFGWVDGLSGPGQCIVNLVIGSICVFKSLIQTIIATTGASAALTGVYRSIGILIAGN